MTMRTALGFHYYVIDDQHDNSILETSTTKSSIFQSKLDLGSDKYAPHGLIDVVETIRKGLVVARQESQRPRPRVTHLGRIGDVGRGTTTIDQMIISIK
jgi:hypothetical protein